MSLGLDIFWQKNDQAYSQVTPRKLTAHKANSS
jgi:hypothetical protein